MCGLAGWVDYTRKLDDEFPAIFAMTDTLALRGPDAEGIWKHRNALLGHRRLAVIDLSGGVQPMSYRFPTGQEVTLVYTGEVYNHDALRERLRRAGHEFRTRSDTEVVLHAYLQWGERCCEYLTGMFAFAVFDGRDGHLLLVRDRLGIKPLYYARHREGLLFGSEIKSILAHPEFAARLDAVGLVDLLTLSRGTSQTPFREVQELLPGHLLSWRPNSQAKLRRYWEVRRQEHADDLQSTVQRTRELVTRALGAQLHADVPVCSLLSGGPRFDRPDRHRPAHREGGARRRHQFVLGGLRRPGRAVPQRRPASRPGPAVRPAGRAVHRQPSSHRAHRQCRTGLRTSARRGIPGQGRTFHLRRHGYLAAPDVRRDPPAFHGGHLR